MATEGQRLLKNKDIILSTIQTRGPSLPISLARTADISTLFASAYLSELYSEKKVLMSNLKVGSTSLYYLKGQEAQLENFIQYLAPKEQEAFQLIKKHRIIDNENLIPAIRVAMQEIKDFANLISLTIDNQQKNFWKYSLLSDEEANSIIQSIIFPQKKQKIIEKKQEITKNEESALSPQKDISSKLENEPKKQRTSRKNIPKDLKFPSQIKEYLLSKDIETLSIAEEKKSLLSAKIRIDSLLGKQEYFLIAKEKKKITEEDILIALHKAQTEKMPALIISSGDLDKNALETAKLWKNLVKFEKIKL